MSNNEVLELLKSNKVITSESELEDFRNQYLKINGSNKRGNENVTITCVDFITTVSEFQNPDYEKDLEVAILKEVQRILNKVSIHYTNKQDVKRTIFVKDMVLREAKVIPSGTSKRTGDTYEEFLSVTKLNHFANEDSLDLTLKVN